MPFQKRDRLSGVEQARTTFFIPCAVRHLGSGNLELKVRLAAILNHAFKGQL
jgi:hypothetical protein